VFVDPKYPINMNSGCPGNAELQDVWMPRPAWTAGGRFNADGSGGSKANNYHGFGVIRLAVQGRDLLRFECVSSFSGSTIDQFEIRKH
jgi:hypothetical protein